MRASRPIDAGVRSGHYARKQLFSRNPLIAWSHRGRFRAALRLAQAVAPRRVLDFGCGDGTFLAMLVDGARGPIEAVGAEISASLVEDCRARLGHRQGLRFVDAAELHDEPHAGTYDLVTCMEVLEHVVDVTPVLDTLRGLLTPHGTLLVTVPVETGLPLVAKQAVRWLAARQGIHDYGSTAPYTWLEYWASVRSPARQHIVRPVYTAADGTQSHDHKGFNWKVLRNALARTFVVGRTVGAPVAWLPPSLGTQVCFIAAPRVAR